MASPFKVGEKVLVYKKFRATVRFVGKIDGDNDTSIGVEYDTPRGYTDGSKNGYRYFKCPKNRGAFVPPKNVTPVTVANHGEKAEKAAVAIQRVARAFKGKQDVALRKAFSNYMAIHQLTEAKHMREEEANKALVAPLLSPKKVTPRAAQKTFDFEPGSPRQHVRPTAVQIPKPTFESLVLPVSSGLPGVSLESIQSMSVTRDYKGPHIDFPLTQATVVELAEHFRHNPEVHLHSKYVLQLLFLSYQKITTRMTRAVTQVHITPETDLYIVGDLHGQLADLLWIFNHFGYPAESRKFLFNGNMVDHGQYGLEVVCIILAFFLLDNVYINRGNHESSQTNTKPADRGGGFSREIQSKYQSEFQKIYSAFEEVFNVLPLMSVISDELAVVHGGLPRKSGVGVHHLSQIRHMRKVPNPSLSDDFQDTLFFDLLWSNPGPRHGVHKSGYGGDTIVFGPDITAQFLSKNGLRKVIRSHQCPTTGRGVDTTHDGKLITVFSASHFNSVGANRGGIILVQKETANSKLEITEHEYIAPTLAEIAEEGVKAELEGYDIQQNDLFAIKRKQAMENLRQATLKEIKHRVVAKKNDLLWYFQNEDVDNTGFVSSQVWREGMSVVLHLDCDWKELQPWLAPPDSQTGQVEYKRFVGRFKVIYSSTSNDQQAHQPSTDLASWEKNLLTSLYESVSKANLSLDKLWLAFGNDTDVLSPDQLAHKIVEQVDLGLSIPQLRFVISEVRSAALASPRKVTGAHFAELFVQTFQSQCEQRTCGYSKEQLRTLHKFGRLVHTVQHSLNTIFHEYDIDNDGYLGYDEFRSAITELQQHVMYDVSNDDEPFAFMNTNEAAPSDSIRKSSKKSGSSSGSLKIRTDSSASPFLSMDEIEALPKIIDLNKDGKINFIEFCHAFYEESNESTVSDLMQHLHVTLWSNRVTLEQIFQHLDEEGDKDGTVTVSELKHGLMTLNQMLSKSGHLPMSEVQINSLASFIDRNQDGKIGWEEFLNAFQVVDTESTQTVRQAGTLLEAPTPSARARKRKE